MRQYGGNKQCASLLLAQTHNIAHEQMQIRRFFVDTVCNWPPALRLTLDFFGVDKLMLGSDHPFWPMSMATEVLDSLDLSPVDRAKIEYENAAGLFQLPVALTRGG